MSQLVNRKISFNKKLKLSQSSGHSREKMFCARGGVPADGLTCRQAWAQHSHAPNDLSLNLSLARACSFAAGLSKLVFPKWSEWIAEVFKFVGKFKKIVPVN